MCVRSTPLCKHMSTQQIRAWCRQKYGNDWWRSDDKASRKREAKEALQASPNSSKRSCASVDPDVFPFVFDESRTWHEHDEWLRAKYGDDWQDPEPEKDGSPGLCYLHGLRCDRAHARLDEARQAVAQTPLPDDFETKLKEASQVAREFLTYTENKAFKTCACFSCDQKIKGGHLYLVEFLPGRKHSKCHYTVGCSHVDYDGEEWCSRCCTLMRVKDEPVVQCMTCAQIDWGRPYYRRNYFHKHCF